MQSYNPLNRQVYIGLSTEVAGLTGANPGDKFIETDTKKVRIYLGAVTGWSQLGSIPDAATTSAAMAALI